jgi:glycosyltransferase involved in cell wall biosynthesis
MKIFIPAGLFYPSKLGGPANTLFWLAKALHSKGVDVTVVTSNNHIDDNSIEFDKWTLVDDIRVRYCTAKSKFPLRIIYFSIKELLKCDVVLLSSFFYKPNIVFALISRILKRKIFWSPRGELFDSALKGSKIKRIYIKIIKSLFSKNVIFHATSLDERDSLIKHLGYNIKTVVIPNLMELPVKRDRIREEKYFLYVGRIAPIKAIDILILGLSKSESFMHSEYKLLIAGDVQNQFKGYNEQIQLILKNESLKE